MIKFLSKLSNIVDENKEDRIPASPFKRQFLKQHEKPLLPTLCDNCYSSFENAVGSAIENGINFVAAYCPHTECMITIEMIDNDGHCVGIYGPMDEATAKELVDERFKDIELYLFSGSFPA